MQKQNEIVGAKIELIKNEKGDVEVRYFDNPGL